MNILAFLGYSIVVTFTPGPTNILIFSTVQNQGIRKALEFVAGATIAFGILLTLSATLNSFLYTAMPKIKIVMGLLGAVYMLYLAHKILYMQVDDSENGGGSFMTGFTMQFINPKVVLFTLTVLANFVIPAYSEPMDIAIFVAILTVIGFCAFSSWVVLGSLFKRFLKPYQKQANLVLALIMTYCAFTVSGIEDIF